MNKYVIYNNCDAIVVQDDGIYINGILTSAVTKLSKCLAKFLMRTVPHTMGKTAFAIYEYNVIMERWRSIRTLGMRVMSCVDNNITITQQVQKYLNTSNLLLNNEHTNYSINKMKNSLIQLTLCYKQSLYYKV